MKKMLALVLVFTLVLGVSVCGSAPAADPAPNTGVPGGTSGDTPDEISGTPEISGDLIVWLNDVPYAEALIEAFMGKYPDVNVEFEMVYSLGSTEKLALDGPAGNGPDVFHCAEVSTGIADGLIEPVPADLQAKIEDLIIESAVNSMKRDGKLYGLPFQLSNAALFYNKDLVDFVPETFERIIEFAKTYNDPAAGKYAFRVQPNNDYFMPIYTSAFGYRIFGPNGDDYKNPGFDSPEYAKGLEFFISLREILDVDTVDSQSEFVYNAFDRGEVPFVFNGPWGITSARDAGLNFGVIKIPTINGVQPEAYAGADMACVSSYAKNPAAAFAFLDFMMSVEGARIRYETMGSAIALKDISNIPGLADDEWLQGFAAQANYTHPLPSIPAMNCVWLPEQDMMSLIWDGVLDIEEGQKKLMEDYELALNAIDLSMYN